ncbi:MAG: S26 family signal peptidase [Vitreimonas sp.]
MRWDRGAEIAMLALAALVAAAMLLPRVRDVILFNPSPSIPRGFYVRTNDKLRVGAVVTVRAVEVAGDYARLRDFADRGDRFIKRVAAVAGDTVCAEGSRVTINGARLIERAVTDSVGRPLPTWSGCRTLGDEVFLVGDTADSFDGRYWGPTPIAAIEGRWRRL